MTNGTRRGWGVSVTPWPLFTPGKDPVAIVQEAGWTPEPVWTSAQNLASHRDSSPGPSRPYPIAIRTTLPGPRGFKSVAEYPRGKRKEVIWLLVKLFLRASHWFCNFLIAFIWPFAQQYLHYTMHLWTELPIIRSDDAKYQKVFVSDLSY
jgi:hypothetical protein